jgi:hypothetical protein
MSVETCAIIENRLRGNEFHSIAHQLNADLRLAGLMHEYDTALRSICPTLVANLHARPWQLELVRTPHEIDQKLVESGWDAGYLAECKGPFGALRLYENLAELSWYMCSWYSFLRERQFGQPLFEATRLVSTLLNGFVPSKAVFVPNSGYNESLVLDELHRTMPELLICLRDKCGPPAPSLDSIVREEEDGILDFRGYYVSQWPGSR